MGNIRISIIVIIVHPQLFKVRDGFVKWIEFYNKRV